MWYFDIQNEADILNGAKPIVTEVGPYAYNEYFNKFDISWSDHGDTVTFYNYKYYIYDQSRTGPGLFETDMLTLPYPTVSGFQHILEEVPVEVTLAVETVINVNFISIILLFFLINIVCICYYRVYCLSHTIKLKLYCGILQIIC